MNTLVLIDGNSLMYRAYYATALQWKFNEDKYGNFHKCTVWFCQYDDKVMDEYNHTHMLVAFDAGKRHLDMNF